MNYETYLSAKKLQEAIHDVERDMRNLRKLESKRQSLQKQLDGLTNKGE